MRKTVAIDQMQLDKIEFLISHSLNGHHLLFDNDTVARILQHPVSDRDFFTLSNLTKIQELFNGLAGHSSLTEKQDFIEDLDDISYELLVRAYFHVLDTTVLARTSLKH